jgi:serine/threonine protein kinase
MSAQPYLKPTSALDRRTMGKYDVLCRLSTGGMSEIFLAYQKGLAGFRKIVVLKSILPDIRGEEEFVRMFLDEAKTTALFNHPNIAQVFDLDVDGDTLFLAMEFVQGCTLVEMARACRQAKEPIPIGFTLTAVRDTALALHYAHTFTDPRGRKQTVIHRDVAEKNIMVTYEGTTKLLDFGIAKALGKTTGHTSIGMVKGTSGYMSPEQIRGEPLDARSDVFSLGVVLHECLTGMRLFHGKTPEEGMLSALREEIPPPSRLNPEVSATIDAVVLKALMREREARYTTSLELARAIEKSAVGQLWHPEHSGELVQRHFADRVKQTRELMEQTQGGEHTGELRIGSLLADLQAKNELRESHRALQPVRDPPKTPPVPPPAPVATLVPPPPQDPGKQRGSNVSPAITAPPMRKETARNARPQAGASREQTETGNREITDPAGAPPAVPPAPMPRMSRPTSVPAAHSAAPTPAAVPMISASRAQPPPDDDDDDVGAKTIPAAILPNGLFAPPPELAARRTSPLPPPVATPPVPPPVSSHASNHASNHTSSPPPPPASALQTTTGETQSQSSKGPLTKGTPTKGTPTPMNGWETFDDDDPGVKTTIARPWDDEPRTGTKLPLYVAIGVGIGLVALGGLMFALDLGPFSKPPKSNAPLLRPAEDLPKKPKPVERPVEKVEAPKPFEKPVEAAPAKPPPEPVKPAPEPEKVAVAEQPKPPAPEPDKVAAAEQEPKAKTAPKTPRKRKKAKTEAESDEDSPSTAAAPEPAPAPAKPPPPAAPATGSLTLVTEPSGLLVTLNGQEIGTTPMFNKTVPAGRQVFKVFSSTGESRSLPLEIKAGQSNSARQDFEALNR